MAPARPSLSPQRIICAMDSIASWIHWIVTLCHYWIMHLYIPLYLMVFKCFDKTYTIMGEHVQTVFTPLAVVTIIRRGSRCSQTRRSQTRGRERSQKSLNSLKSVHSHSPRSEESWITVILTHKSQPIQFHWITMRIAANTSQNSNSNSGGSTDSRTDSIQSSNNSLPIVSTPKQKTRTKSKKNDGSTLKGTYDKGNRHKLSWSRMSQTQKDNCIAMLRVDGESSRSLEEESDIESDAQYNWSDGDDGCDAAPA
eukprot:621232_1